MYSHSWVTELSSITKWHIQFTGTALPAVHHVWLCLVIKLQPSKTVLSFRVILPLPFIFIVFPVTSLSFIICDFFAFLEVFSYRECAPTSLLFMPAPDYRTELWEVFPMHALEYKSFSALPKLGMYAKARGRDCPKVINSVLSPTLKRCGFLKSFKFPSPDFCCGPPGHS